MLCCRTVHKSNEGICGKSYHQFPTLPSVQWTCRKICSHHENLFHKVKEEGADIEKYLMIYHNTPLASTSKSPMQMLQQRLARSQLPMSNAARRRLGIVAEHQPHKNQHLP